jgi:hypothetical protein
MELAAEFVIEEPAAQPRRQELALRGGFGTHTAVAAAPVGCSVAAIAAIFPAQRPPLGARLAVVRVQLRAEGFFGRMLVWRVRRARLGAAVVLLRRVSACLGCRATGLGLGTARISLGPTGFGRRAVRLGLAASHRGRLTYGLGSRAAVLGAARPLAQCVADHAHRHHASGKDAD